MARIWSEEDVAQTGNALGHFRFPSGLRFLNLLEPKKKVGALILVTTLFKPTCLCVLYNAQNSAASALPCEKIICRYRDLNQLQILTRLEGKILSCKSEITRVEMMPIKRLRNSPSAASATFLWIKSRCKRKVQFDLKCCSRKESLS